PMKPRNKLSVVGLGLIVCLATVFVAAGKATATLEVNPSEISFTAYLYPGQESRTYSFNISVTSDEEGENRAVVYTDEAWLSLGGDFTISTDGTRVINIPQFFTLNVIVSEEFFPEDGVYTGRLTIREDEDNEATVTITVNVTGRGEALEVDPSEISFTAYLYPGQESKDYLFNVSVTGTEGSNVIVSTDQSWLSVEGVDEGQPIQIPCSLTLKVTVSKEFFLEDKVYTGKLTIREVGNINNEEANEATVTVTVRVTGRTRALEVSPSEISFTAYLYPGQESRDYSFNISVDGGDSAVISTSQPWLSVEGVEEGQATQLPCSFTLKVTVSNEFFPEDGVYTGEVVIKETGDITNTEAVVTVTVTVIHAIRDKLTVTPSSVTLYFTRANLIQRSFTVEVANANYTRDDFKWSAEVTEPWITISPSTGVGKTSVTVTVDPSALPAGKYCNSDECEFNAGVITFRSNLPTENSEDAEATLTIRLVIEAPNELSVFPSYLFWSVELPEDVPEDYTLPDFTTQVLHVYAGPYGFSLNYNVPWLSITLVNGDSECPECLSTNESEGIFEVTPDATLLWAYGPGRYEGTIQVIDRGTEFYREIPVTVEIRRHGEPISLPVNPPRLLQMTPGFVLVEATEANWLHMLLHVDDVTTYSSEEACLTAGGTWIDPFTGGNASGYGLPYCSASEKVYVLLSAPAKAPGKVYAYTPVVPEQFMLVYSNGVLNPDVNSLDPFFSVGPIPEADFGPMQLAGLYGQLFVNVRVGSSINSTREVQQVQVNIYTLEGTWLVSEEYQGESYTYGSDRLLVLNRNADGISYSGTWGTGTLVNATIGDGKSLLYRIEFTEQGINYEYEVTSLGKSEMHGRWRFCYDDDCSGWEKFSATRLSNSLGTAINNPF
ncbi:MAG: BACON domain-containing protein, partial [Deltaproteobacteria bacterium]|nr:BACON domain-containing protein [Deltaproteobacteria bacterium]